MVEVILLIALLLPFYIKLRGLTVFHLEKGVLHLEFAVSNARENPSENPTKTAVGYLKDCKKQRFRETRRRQVKS